MTGVHQAYPAFRSTFFPFCATSDRFDNGNPRASISFLCDRISRLLLLCSTHAVRIPVRAQALEGCYEKNPEYRSAPEGEQRDRDPRPDAVCEHHARLPPGKSWAAKNVTMTTGRMMRMP